MLRLVFVLGIITLGLFAASQSAFYALLFYLWNAYFRPEQWVWSDLVSSLNLSFVIAGILLVKTVFSSERARVSPRVIIVGLLFALSLLSTSLSESPDWSWHYWEDFAKVMVITYLMVVLVTDRHRLRLVLLVIALSIGVEGAKQGYIGALLHPGTPNMNDHPVLGDNNGVAQAMMMLVPVFALLAQTAQQRWEKYTHRFLALGVLLRGLSTYSRGGLLAGVAVAVMAIWRSPNRLRVGLVVLVLSGVALSAMPQQFWDRMDTLTDSPEEQDDSAKGRLHFWQVAVEMAGDHPLVGVGFNGFSMVYDKYDFSDGLYGAHRAVHSAWFGVLAEMGIPGLALFVVTILLAFNTCRNVRNGAAGNPELALLRPYAIALETGLLAYVVGATFLNSQYTEIFWHMIGLTMALDVMAREAVRKASEAPARITMPEQLATAV